MCLDVLFRPCFVIFSCEVFGSSFRGSRKCLQLLCDAFASYLPAVETRIDVNLAVFDVLMDHVSQIYQLSRCVLPPIQWTFIVVLRPEGCLSVYLDILSQSEFSTRDATSNQWLRSRLSDLRLSGSTSFTPVRQMCNVVDLPKARLPCLVSFYLKMVCLFQGDTRTQYSHP